MAIGISRYRQPMAFVNVTRYTISLPDQGKFLFGGYQEGPKVSPDGRRIAFIANVSGVEQICTKAADSLLAQPIAATEHAIAVFWSPASCSTLRDFLREIRDGPFCEQVLDKMNLAERPHGVFFERSDCFIYLDVARRAAPLLRHSVTKSLLHLYNAPLHNRR
jgi:hypothetical protein